MKINCSRQLCNGQTDGHCDTLSSCRSQKSNHKICMTHYVCVFICWRVAPLPVCAINSYLESVFHSGKVFLHLFNFSAKLLCDTFDVNKLNSEKIKSNHEVSYTIHNNLKKQQLLPKFWKRMFLIFPSLSVSQQTIHQHITESLLCL